MGGGETIAEYPAIPDNFIYMCRNAFYNEA